MSLSLLKFAIHVATNLWQAHIGWGYFYDEPYYIMCSRHLDWAYVDHGPIVALQTWLAIFLFGKSLAGIRVLSSLAGAAKVLLTGLFAWEFGARRAGQALAMIGVLLAPAYLGVDSFLSMNSFESAFWMTAAYAIVRIISGGTEKWWIVFGIAAGIGCENKPSMVFFLFALLLGLLLTPQRKILLSRAMPIGVGIAILLVLPLLIWEVRHDWAMIQFLHNSRVARSYRLPSPLKVVVIQMIYLSPFNLPMLGGGLVWLLAGKSSRKFRFLGWTFLFFLGLMILMREDGKEYYITPVYPFLFAAGGMACEAFAVAHRKRWLLPAYCGLVGITGLLLLPLSVPVTSPEGWIAYAKLTHLRSAVGQRDKPLFGFLTIRFGWQEIADAVTQVYRSLPATDQAKAGIFCSTYPEASAVNFLADGRGLPFATSGHNNYFLWGPHEESGAVMIIVTSAPRKEREEMLQHYESVELAGILKHPYTSDWMTYIYICRDYKGAFIHDWPLVKHYD